MIRPVDPRATLGSLASQVPDNIAVFDSVGLDYSCGGNQTLQEACQETCQEAGIALSDVLPRLQFIPMAATPAHC